jgi:hypothetical protein
MRHDPLSVFRQSYSYRTAPLLPLPAGRGEGRGEGPVHTLRLAARPPHPASPWPVEDGRERPNGKRGEVKTAPTCD